MTRIKARIFWPITLACVLADCTTKRLAAERLPDGVPAYDVVRDFVRFSLAYNPGAVFGLPASRWMLSLLAIVVLVVLAHFYRATAPNDRMRATALALLCGGAIGNLIDRLLSARGVVDFIDIGIGTHRFWTFNLADVGVTLGAAILALTLIRDEVREPASASTESQTASSPPLSPG
ncbi:MAG TPA: signal peptidase II [Gemmatimonadaceae bacterium]|nr:signal peptidase II [Gemmatimonadaceae bacterium]